MKFTQLMNIGVNMSICLCTYFISKNAQPLNENLVLLFIMHSSDPYKATSPLDIELVIG